MSSHITVQVKVADLLRPYADLAVVRLTYLFKDVTFVIHEGALLANIPVGRDASEVTREFSYALYREKIYADTLDMRTAFVQAVTQR